MGRSIHIHFETHRALDAKISKADADYLDQGTVERHCGTCSMFTGDATSGTCSLVEGRILEDGVCRYWEAK